MDTKWNSTDKGPKEAPELVTVKTLPEAAGSAAVEQPSPGRGRQARAVIGFLAFFLGLSLTLGSLGAIAGRLVWQRGASPLETDWQETDAFRGQVSAYLRDFLTLAAGEELTWYNDWYGGAATEEVLVSGWGGVAVSEYETALTPVPSYPDDMDPDYWYQNDKNVLYRIRRQGSVYSPGEWYSNTDGAVLSRNLPEGYHFLLTFANGKVTILKDGVELDVYGDGVYTEDSDWFVPGYDNFPAGDNVSSAVVYMAVRETPTQYYSTDYGVRTSDMYWPYQSLQEARSFWLTQAAALAAGLVLLAVWFALRREKRLADEKLASWTVHVWTEPRFLAVAACLLWMTAGNSYVSDMAWALRHELFQGWNYWAGLAGRYLLCLPLSNSPALLALVWVVWLIHNDHRYNPKERRRSLLRGLFRALRARDLKRPVQKRLARNSVTRFLILLAVFLPSMILAIRFSYDGTSVLFFAAAALILILLLYTLWGRRDRALARDIGLLADQVEAIRNGDLSTPLELPEDADLRQTAEALNDIQAGLHRALEEQTRSERMKVELISNVSHDLKTPLTSILSYAELLRQEELTGAAADYARIIDEKAQRLKGMVQDVFEVSKAAAGQLPVHLERLDLAKLLRQTLADMDDPIRASQLTFKLDLPEEPVMIVADGKRLYRVFQNLIQNALQYALEGSRVYLSLKTGQGRAEASLRNTSRSELPEGVDFTARFVRGDESRTDGGSGLGLSIASSFTEACGGEFRVETVADLFTAVVSFPLAEG